LQNEENYRRNFVEDSIRTFATSNKWSFRQLYAVLCESILERKIYKNFESFADAFLPKLLLFRNDKVANIRVSLARCVVNYLIEEYFKQQHKNAQTLSPLILNEIELTMHYLLKDQDSDVKLYMSILKENYNYHNNNSSSVESEENFEEVVGPASVKMNHQENELEKSYEMKESSNFSNNNITKEVLMMETSPPASNVNIANVIYTDDSDDQTSSTNNIKNFNKNSNLIHDEEDDDDEDEIIDKTNLNQLKIVNLEHDLDDDEMASSETSITNLNTTENKNNGADLAASSTSPTMMNGVQEECQVNDDEMIKSNSSESKNSSNSNSSNNNNRNSDEIY
jgi:hypothetical protein